MVVMDQHRGWELVADEKKRADKVVAAMADSINFATQASTMPPPPPPPAPPAPPGIILTYTCPSPIHMYLHTLIGRTKQGSTLDVISFTSTSNLLDISSASNKNQTHHITITTSEYAINPPPFNTLSLLKQNLSPHQHHQQLQKNNLILLLWIQTSVEDWIERLLCDEEDEM